MTDPPTRTVRIAVAQYEPRIGDLGGNRAAAVAQVEAAADSPIGGHVNPRVRAGPAGQPRWCCGPR